MRARIARRPLAWVLVTAFVALIAGTAIGMAGGVPQSDLDDAKAEIGTLTSALKASERSAAIAAERARTADTARDAAVEEAERITAKGEVPRLTGRTVDEARESAVVGDFEWAVSRTSKVSRATPGTIISQRPRPGSSLARGGTLRVVVAKKAPPKPKQWVTIFSESGAGSKRTGEFRIPDDLKVRVRYTFGGDTNDTLQLKSPDEGDDSFGDLLVNEIGPHSGTTRLYGKSGAYYLDIGGDSWTVEVQVFRRP